MNEVNEPMEQEIVKEENLNNQENTPKNPPKVNIQPKKVLDHQKLITIIILFSTIVVITIGLNSLSKKNQEEISSQPLSQTNSPQPAAPADTNSQNIAQRVKTYNSKLESLDNYRKKLQRPIVDLEISFK